MHGAAPGCRGLPWTAVDCRGLTLAYPGVSLLAARFASPAYFRIPFVSGSYQTTSPCSSSCLAVKLSRPSESDALAPPGLSSGSTMKRIPTIAAQEAGRLVASQ